MMSIREARPSISEIIRSIHLTIQTSQVFKILLHSVCCSHAYDESNNNKSNNNIGYPNMAMKLNKFAFRSKN
ncbi:hypothetical protein BK123_06390 [Paenibacillus lautus]|uniref:Uncharacterized protein n=1 Tax=Paenibacillus lautus TaxID=1401 RepID=A0A1R1B576_PAELA|nr:hypothetical protein BK123_06390 [Paenibacillus lautus]